MGVRAVGVQLEHAGFRFGIAGRGTRHVQRVVPPFDFDDAVNRKIGPRPGRQRGGQIDFDTHGTVLDSRVHARDLAFDDAVAGINVCGLADQKVAVLVGAEGPGLTETAMRASDVRVRIPMARGTDSLNVATAAALAFYERARSLGGARVDS